jgi:hypothetical protein
LLLNALPFSDLTGAYLQVSAPRLAKLHDRDISRVRGWWATGPFRPVRDHLLGHGVVAVVVAPGWEQLVLALGGLAGQVADPADDQPGGDGLAFLRGERGLASLGDHGVGDLYRQRVADRRPRVFGYRGDRAPDRGVHPGGDREVRPGAGLLSRALAPLRPGIPRAADRSSRARFVRIFALSR